MGTTAMIKESMVAMALIGCDCDAKMCEYIRTTDASWSTVAECETDIRSRIVKQHENYPLVIAVCRDGSDASAKALEASLPMAGRTAVAEAASIVAPIVTTAEAGAVSADAAGRITTLFPTLNGYVSVRDTVGGAWSTASRRALDTASWLKQAVTPQWF
jgi:hypothetical protein